MAELSVDSYVIDTLMPDLIGHDRHPSSFIVFLYLWRHTVGRGNTSAQVSLMDLSTETGLSKRAVQDALTRLVKRRLVSASRASITAVPVYVVRQPWKRG